MSTLNKTTSQQTQQNKINKLPLIANIANSLKCYHKIYLIKNNINIPKIKKRNIYNL